MSRSNRFALSLIGATLLTATGAWAQVSVPSATEAPRPDSLAKSPDVAQSPSAEPGSGQSGAPAATSTASALGGSAAGTSAVSTAGAAGTLSNGVSAQADHPGSEGDIEPDHAGLPGEDGDSKKGKKGKKNKNKNKDKTRDPDRDKNGGRDKDGDGDHDDEIWEQPSKIRVSGYIYSAFFLNDKLDTPNNEFRVRNARLQLDWKQGDLIDGVVELELSKEEDQSGTAWSPLRDAYVRLSPLKELRVRVGQFKRPFSRLALMSHRELRLIDRGIGYAWISRELDYGDRDIGIQIDGTLGKGIALDYALAVFNGTGRNMRETDPQGAKDFVGRLNGHLGKYVSIGTSLSHKRWDNPPATVAWVPNATMWEADAAFDYKGFYAMVEGGYGDNFLSPDHAKSSYALGMVAYKMKLTPFWDMALEPLVKAEMVAPVQSNAKSRSYDGTVGVNWHIANVFRLMVQGELVSPKESSALPSNLGEAESLKRITVQAALHTK